MIGEETRNESWKLSAWLGIKDYIVKHICYGALTYASFAHVIYSQVTCQHPSYTNTAVSFAGTLLCRAPFISCPVVTKLTCQSRITWRHRIWFNLFSLPTVTSSLVHMCRLLLHPASHLDFSSVQIPYVYFTSSQWHW